jgi:arylsulfatase A-like enzyme
MRAMSIFACISMSLPATDYAGAQDRPPNIVVIGADDMGYGDIGTYGGKDIPTPNLDALAAGGIRFTNAYVTGPFCSPTRAGLLTGRYPQRFGHEFNIGQAIPAHRDVGLPVEETTMADRLKAVGYRTALVGKWHLGSAERFQPTRRGFDEFFGFLHGSHSYTAPMVNNNPIFEGTERVTQISYLTEAFADRAAEFIRQNRSRPFFLYLAFNAPHVPLQATDKYLARFTGITNPTRRTYAAMLSAMDDGIGRTMTALRDARLEEKTLVFFFSDNGGPLSANSWNGSSNGPLRGDKGDTWEGGIRVPFTVQWKGTLPQGTINARPVVQLDVLPTALAAAKVEIRPEWKLDGVNLLPFLNGRASGDPHDAIYWRTGAIMAIRKGDWKLVRMLEGPDKVDPAALNLTNAELYNISDDVSESRPLASRFPERVRELSDDWQRWRSQLAAPAWPSTEAGRDAITPCVNRPAASSLASYAGSWRGSILAPGSDNVLVTWTWVQNADSSGRFTFAAETTSTITHVLILSPDSIVVDLASPIRRPDGTEVMLRLVGSACGNDLAGYAISRAALGGATRARLVGVRTPPR